MLFFFNTLKCYFDEKNNINDPKTRKKFITHM